MALSGIVNPNRQLFLLPFLLLFILLVATEIHGAGEFDHIVRSSADEVKWCYKKETCPNDSPTQERWPGNCADKKQSPINIVPSDATTKSKKLAFKDSYKTDIKAGLTLKNTAHSALLELDKEATEQIKLESTSGMYKLAQGHFHWGMEKGQGSEHLLDNKAYPVELHLVHFNAKYSDINKAIESKVKDALLVIGIFLEESGSKNSAYDFITESLKEIGKPTVEGFKINKSLNIFKFLPTDHSFYFYDGSLTTPGCAEVVQWIVMKTPVSISKEQLDEFRKLKSYGEKDLGDNYRFKQDLNKREIGFSEAGESSLLRKFGFPQFLFVSISTILSMMIAACNFA